MSKFSNMKLKWKLTIGFAIPLTLIMTISTIVYFNLDRLLKSSEWVNHTNEVINLGNGITQSLVNMETGFRGFLVVGDEEFLAPFIQGEKDFLRLVDETKQRVADNPQQVSRLEQVESMEAKWLEEHTSVGMKYRREVNKGEMAARLFKKISARTVGKEKFDGFRQALGEVDIAFTLSNDIEAQNIVKLILMDMINQETGQRGFLLSGQEASLDPYTNGIRHLEKHTADLKHLIDNAYDRPTARQNLTAIKKIIRRWEDKVANPGMEIKKR